VPQPSLCPSVPRHRPACPGSGREDVRDGDTGIDGEAVGPPWRVVHRLPAAWGLTLAGLTGRAYLVRRGGPRAVAVPCSVTAARVVRVRRMSSLRDGVGEVADRDLLPVRRANRSWCWELRWNVIRPSRPINSNRRP